MSIKPKPPRVAQIITQLTGKLVGGIIHKSHKNREVTILYGGLQLRGKPLTREDIFRIEAATLTGQT